MIIVKLVLFYKMLITKLVRYISLTSWKQLLTEGLFPRD